MIGRSALASAGVSPFRGVECRRQRNRLGKAAPLVVVLLLGCTSANEHVSTAAATDAAPVTIELVAERPSVQPGDEMALVLRFRVRPGSNLFFYSEPAPRSGPQVELSWSAANVVIEPVWSAPERIELDDGSVVFEYRDEALMLHSAKVSPDAQPGTDLTVVARASWFVDSMPGSGTTSLAIPIVSKGADLTPATTTLFDRWSSRLPDPARTVQDIPGLALDHVASSGGHIHEWRLEVPRASELEYFPYPEVFQPVGRAGPRPLHFLERRSLSPTTLLLRFSDDGQGRRYRARGLVRVRSKAGEAYYLFGHGFMMIH